MKYYQLTTFTFAALPPLRVELARHRALFSKTGADRLDMVDLGNRNGILLSRFLTRDDFERGRVINNEIFASLTESGVVDAMTLQPHDGTPLLEL
jgi:hypothetical protein